MRERDSIENLIDFMKAKAKLFQLPGTYDIVSSGCWDDAAALLEEAYENFKPISIIPKELIEIGKRFQGFDIQYRRFGSGWEKPWRIRIFSSKHHQARTESCGDTLEEAWEKKDDTN